MSELELLKTLKPHRHIIKLLGCVTESGRPDESIANVIVVVVVVVVVEI